MATLNPTIAIGGSGGSGGPGGGSFTDYHGRLRRARLGLAVALTPIAMLFISFTSAYIVRQGLPTFDEHSGTYIRDWLTVNLPVTLLLINTALLLISGLTMELARRQIARRVSLSPVGSVPGVSIGEEGTGTVPWLGITVVLGVGFLAGQALAWRTLADRGFYMATSPSSSFVYLLTATHAVHLSGGMLVLLFALAASLFRRPVESRYIVVDTAAWYWHFMALLWVYIFALLEFAR
jgi:cytochrome c oxidase subunit 3